MSILKGRTPYDWDYREPLAELDLPACEFERRLNAVRQWLASNEIDVLAVVATGADVSNARYLSGYAATRGTSIVLVHRDRDPVLVTSSIAHLEPMHSNFQTIWMKQVLASATPAGVVAIASDVLAQWGSSLRVGVCDPGNIQAWASAAVRAAWSGHRLIDADGALRRLRSRKSPDELAIIRKGAGIISEGMNAAMAASVAGATEADVAAEAHAVCVRAGIERMDFGCAVASGKRSAMKNMAPKADKLIQPGELVMIDLGFRLRGYQTDMARNMVAGPASEPVLKMLEVCLAAEEAAFEFIRPGVTTADVVNVMAETAVSNSLSHLDWSFCHGFGLELEEEPFFLEPVPRVLEAGMCFYVEPIILDTELGCACIEDMVVVTETGCEVLTDSPRKTW